MAMDRSTPSQSVLHTVALTVFELSTISSLVFLFVAGQHQSSIVLKILFAVWVFLPFAGLFVLERHFKRSAFLIQRKVQRLLLVSSLASVTAYSGIFLPEDTKSAFIFLVTPLAVWLAIVISFFILKKQESKF